MGSLANKRSMMIFYSGKNDIYSHRTRIVLAEKGVAVDIIYIDPEDKPKDLLEINPYQTVPTLVDRDLILFQSNIIMEYLDERFPYPPLLPVYPVARAKSRLTMFRIEKDWCELVKAIEEGPAAQANAARKVLKESLLAIEPVFAETPYFLSEDFSLIDCMIGPILWRLPSFEIELPAKSKALLNYMERVFARESFQKSLTEIERELQK